MTQNFVTVAYILEHSLNVPGAYLTHCKPTFMYSPVPGLLLIFECTDIGYVSCTFSSKWAYHVPQRCTRFEICRSVSLEFFVLTPLHL